MLHVKLKKNKKCFSLRRMAVEKISLQRLTIVAYAWDSTK